MILSIGVGQSGGTALAGTLASHPLAGPALPAAGATAAMAVLLLAYPFFTAAQRPGRRGRHRRARGPGAPYPPDLHRTNPGPKRVSAP